MTSRNMISSMPQRNLTDEAEDIVTEYRKIREDYAFNSSPMCADDERARAIKEIISTKLSKVDQIIIILYIELQSYRKLAKRMQLSHMTCRREVMRIKKIILEEYEKLH